MPLITVDAKLAAELLRDLATKVEEEAVTLTHIENLTWTVLGKGTVRIEWKERDQ